jgi:hypothetical protein
MSFLGDLADQISSQFNFGENTTTTLDTFANEEQTEVIKYGALGDFASKFDQSAERKYVEEGYLRRDPYNTDPKQFEILWQEPSATVLLKKRMFSSIAENYRPDFMDADEKLYYKAINILFKNKCNQISALEKLSKIQQVTAAVGNVTDQLIPLIITLGDIAKGTVFDSGSGGIFGGGNNLFGALGGNTNPFNTPDGNSFIKTTDRLKVLYGFNQTNPTTTWITDTTNLLQSTFGGGTGVIELTNFININTSTSVDLKSPGTFNISIADPYEAMLITDYDIEVALSDATNLFYNKKIFQFGVTSANEVITRQQNQLNAIRSARNASPITFKIDRDTLLGKRVRAIIDRQGVEIQFKYDPLDSLSLGGNNGVEVNDDFLRDGAIAGYDGLDTGPGYTGFPWTSNARSKSHGNSELQAFQIIIATIFQQLTLLANSAGNFTANNKSYNYARKKLRFNFSGKLIVQPMDVIHIYMNSKSQFDNKILAGLTQMFSGFGILQNINNTITSITNASDILFNPSANISVMAEKAMFVGPDFPSSLWAMVRKQFVGEHEGTHVFAGVVESAVDNWSAGRFVVDVSGKDNTIYFDQGKVNFKPGVDAFNGLIFDPLTPFQSNYDVITLNNSPPNSIPQLLEENMYLLSQTGSGSMVKYKLGALAGEKATQGNYIQDQSIDPFTGLLTRVFYAPDGLVYKWKQGIGIFTQFGSSNQINDPNLVGNPNIYAEPFAGLDVMNVLSLLITGVPYNFATYYKATSNLYGFSGDPQSRQASSHSFIQSLKNDLSKNNSLWGNFIPFKNLVMNESAIAQAMQAQLTVANANADLDSKLKKLADLQNVATAIGAVNALSSKISNTDDPTQARQVTEVQSQINNLVNDINSSISTIQKNTKYFYSQVDNSAAYDSNHFINGKNNPSDSSNRKQLRKQTNYLTRRMSYDVRANKDKNLFIVDDYYDIDYDIAAFNKSLADGVKMYSNEFTSVREKILNVADLLNLEVFCDTQGHIRVRPPQYNRMPSSVFHRMIYLKQALGVQIFPQFLNSLFTDQLTTLRTRIEIIEDQIRLDCAILNKYSSIDLSGDQEAQKFLTSANITGGMSSTFSFISDSSGRITDIPNLIDQANQEASGNALGLDLASFKKISAAGTSTKQLFANSERYSVLFNALQSQNQNQDGINVSLTAGTTIFQSTVVQDLIDRINTKSGQHIVSKDYLTPAQANQPIEIDTGETIDLFKVTNELATYMQEWQFAVKLFYHTIKNSAESRSLDDGTTTSNSLLNPGLFGNSYIPEVYEHMIEDESYDDYGPGSGKRYVIKRSQIRNISISENPPPWTSVEVQGTLEFFKENEGPPGLDSFPGGGNALVTAIAVDYDMWRNYGFKSPAVVKVPFLSDPASQCGPYASMILTRNRSNILRGSVTISGNEYMQPGEVVFIEDRNLLFYVNSVRHSMTQGSGFTTTLELTYGHSIGEYIPTYMDTIGKLIYKNREVVATIIQRQDSSAPEQNIGVVQLDPKNKGAPITFTGNKGDFVSSFSESNTTVINNILYNTAYLIRANGTKGNNIKTKVELRVYHDSKTGVDSQLLKQANGVMQMLTGVSQGPVNFFGQNQPVQNFTLDKKWVEIVKVNIDDEEDRRSPSQKAIDAARNQMAGASTNTGSISSSNPVGNDDGTNTNTISPDNRSLRKVLFSYIIDCWITFTQVSDEEANSI